MTALELRASGELAIPRRLVDAARTLVFLLVSLVVGIGDLVVLPIAAIAGPAAVRRMLECERALVNQLLVRADPGSAAAGARQPRSHGSSSHSWPESFRSAWVRRSCVRSRRRCSWSWWRTRFKGSLRAPAHTSGRGRWVPSSDLCSCSSPLPALTLSVGALEATAALISQISRRGLSQPGRRRRPRAGGARRAAGRSNARNRVLAPRAAAVRRRARPSGHASGTGHVEGMDGCGTPRRPGCRDHP